jgi:FKBP-type peptidyl-prolyl cis-trans isomerase
LEPHSKTKIGVGQVIKGWDEGVLSTDGGMSLGEKATLTITGYVRRMNSKQRLPPQ